MKQVLVCLVLLIGFSAADALACMCNPGETEEPLKKAEVAFIGRPIMIEVIPRRKPSTTTWQRIKDSVSAMLGSSPTMQALEHPEFLDSVRVTFEVSEYTKGTGDKHFQVMTGYGDSDCGLPVSISKRYTIYARRINGALRTSYCFGSSEYVRPQRQLPCPHDS
jgi:hypothetical protein